MLKRRRISLGVLGAAAFLASSGDGFTIHQTRFQWGRRHPSLKAKEDAAPSSTVAASEGRRQRQQQQQGRRSNKSKGGETSYNNKRRTSSSFQEAKQLNQRITRCQDVNELLTLLQKSSGALTKRASGGALNSVNFSTSLHRLARHSLYNKSDSRAALLTDFRFALFLASLAEALVAEVRFGPRELANIAWALAKVEIAPPASALAVSGIENDDNSAEELLTKTSSSIREEIYRQIELRRNGDRGALSQPTWIPSLSQLAGHILDRVGRLVLQLLIAHEQSAKGRQMFRLQELSILIWSFATAGRAHPLVHKTVTRTMLQQQRQSNQPLKAQEWANSMYSYAKARIYEYGDLLQFLAQVMPADPDFVAAFKSQEISNTLWAVATLVSNQDRPLTEQEEKSALAVTRVIAQAMEHRAYEYRSQELANSLWSLATVGFGSSAAAGKMADDEAAIRDNNNYVFLQSDQPDVDHAIMRRALDAVVEASLPVLYRFKAQELNNLAWALARLVDAGDVTEPIRNLISGIGREIANPRKSVTQQDVGMTLWSAAKLGHFDDDELYRALAARISVEQVRRGNPQEIANAVYSFGVAGVEIFDIDAFDTSIVPASRRPDPIRDPITYAFGVAAEELMRRPFEFKPQEIKDVLWSFSTTGIRHPALFKATAEHLVGVEKGDPSARGLDQFSPQGLGNLAWAYARQAQLANDVTARLKWPLNIAHGNGRLAVYTVSYLDVGEAQLQRLFQSIARADIDNHNKLANLSPQDIANTIWAFAVLGLVHSEFAEVAKVELASRINRFVEGDTRSKNRFKGQEIANFLWALATQNVPAGDLLLGSIIPFFDKTCTDDISGIATPEAIARVFKRQELANIAWSFGVFGEYPPAAIETLYEGLLGLRANADPVSVSRAHRDVGLQQEAVMSLLYLQSAMNLAGCNQHLRLPDNFPEAWTPKGPVQHDDGQLFEASSNFGLNLTTSKIQRTVSAAFTRIGFDHVQEHIITMEEMAQLYDINFPAKPLEILSIDIANVDEKIAIEVDGPAHFLTEIENHVEANGFTREFSNKLEYQFQWNGELQRFNGATALKDTVLSLLGWEVIHLPFWEWYEMNADEAAEDEYCRGLLESGSK